MILSVSLCVWLKVPMKAQSENSWLHVHCAPCSLHWLVKLHSHKACKVLTQQFRFITTGSAEYLFRQRWTETKLALTWKLCCISAPEYMALIVTFFPDATPLCQEAATWPYNMLSFSWYDQDVPQQTCWDCQSDEQSVGGFHGHSDVLSLTADSEEPAGQQMICLSRDTLLFGRFWLKECVRLCQRASPRELVCCLCD